jgi:DNA-binding transcriptional LysR family regulator
LTEGVPIDTWSDLAVFLAAAREGSATRAAARLGLTVTTVTRRLSKLEEATGRPLFVRTADGLTLTSAEEALFPHAERVEQSALAGLASVQALEERPSGRVELALPGDMVTSCCCRTSGT